MSINDENGLKFTEGSEIGKYYFVHQVKDSDEKHLEYKEWEFSVLDSCKGSVMTISEAMRPTIPRDYEITRNLFELNALENL